MKIKLLISILLISLLSFGQKSLTKKDFIKKPPHNRGTIYDYLDLFTIASCNSYTEKVILNDEVIKYLDEESKRLYSTNTRTIITFDNGIVFWTLDEHEGQIFELFIPIISTEEAEKLLINLCKTMGGCIPPEDTIVIFREYQGGVLVSWGGGC